MPVTANAHFTWWAEKPNDSSVTFFIEIFFYYARHRYTCHHKPMKWVGFKHGFNLLFHLLAYFQRFYLHTLACYTTLPIWKFLLAFKSDSTNTEESPHSVLTIKFGRAVHDRPIISAFFNSVHRNVRRLIVSLAMKQVSSELICWAVIVHSLHARLNVHCMFVVPLKPFRTITELQDVK